MQRRLHGARLVILHPAESQPPARHRKAAAYAWRVTPQAAADEIREVRDRVTAELLSFIDSREPILTSISPELDDLHLTLRDFLRSGKRLRPLFCWWGWRAAGGGSDNEAALRAATSLEFLQACALIHDDVMDGSETRRGLPAAHKRLATLHAQHHWHGDPGAFGVAGAILLGDLCLSWNDEMFLECGLPMDDVLRAKKVLDITRTELMGGQYLDVVEQAKGNASIDQTLRVARYKSAKYTIERPLHIGATLAGASPEIIEAFTGYGLPLGEAFQIRDDVLGIFGDPGVTGKPAGDDIREGKRTFLIAATLEETDQAQTKLVHDALGNPDLRAEDVTAIRRIIVDTGALGRAEDHIASCTEQALSALDTVDLTPPAREVLGDLALAATNRRV